MKTISPVKPLNVSVSREPAPAPAINLLLPELAPGMSGGPNTALNLVCRLGRRGIPLRLIACDQPLPKDMAALKRSIETLTSTPLASTELLSAVDHAQPIVVGPKDLFIATYWTTAHNLKPILPQFDRQDFIYLIQDYEPAFFPWSSGYAWARETYAMNFRAVINEQLLADYLCSHRIGRFADPGFMERCAVFQPAVDARFFHPVPVPVPAKRPIKQLLFYARPHAPRNLFELGYAALNLALRHPIFAAGEWDFLGIGGQNVPDLPLEGARALRSVPWKDYESYAALLRDTDILLGLMLSPHTSYPVLEAAACGCTVVTNSFETKTASRLEAISHNIMSADPVVEDIAATLVRAAQKIAAGDRSDTAINLPKTWDDALESAVAMVADIFRGGLT